MHMCTSCIISYVHNVYYGHNREQGNTKMALLESTESGMQRGQQDLASREPAAVSAGGDPAGPGTANVVAERTSEKCGGHR